MCILFADDSSLQQSSYNELDIEQKLNHDLHVLELYELIQTKYAYLVSIFSQFMQTLRDPPFFKSFWYLRLLKKLSCILLFQITFLITINQIRPGNGKNS